VEDSDRHFVKGKCLKEQRKLKNGSGIQEKY
jgi:hypothetical protein